MTPIPTRTSPDVVVVGGGIVGTSAAAFLAEAGARVVLVERDGLASGASGANAGGIWHPVDPVLVELYRASLPVDRELAATSNTFRMGELPVGLLEVSRSEAAVRAEAAAQADAYPDLQATVLDPDALALIEPGLADDLWACRLELGYPVAPASGTYAFASRAEAAGAVLRSGRAAVLALDHDRLVGVDLDGERIACGSVLAAAGAWTRALLRPTGFVAPIRPLWGVVVEVEPADPPRHIIEELPDPASAVARASGSSARSSVPVLASDAVRETPSVEHVHVGIVPTPGVVAAGATELSFEPEPEAWIEPLLGHVATFLPRIVDAPIRGVRCCPRPLSADGLPLIGDVPGVRGLVVAAGHGPWGISTGPESGRLAAELALGRAPAIAPELDPARFARPA